MASDDLNNLLQKIHRMDAEDCGRLLSAYLELATIQDRQLVLQFVERLASDPFEIYH